MKKLITKMKEVKCIPCENCGSIENVYKIVEKNNFTNFKKSTGYLCKKCWLYASKCAYDECFTNKKEDAESEKREKHKLYMREYRKRNKEKNKKV